MRIRFGTDGVRGKANSELTAEVAVALGHAAAVVLTEEEWVIGWDTRVSSPMLVSAFGAGIESAGKTVTQLGELPSGGVAFECFISGIPGAMVTASHNPFSDNGIKIFGPNGSKLPEEVEGQIEGIFFQILETSATGAGKQVVGAIGQDGPTEEAAKYKYEHQQEATSKYERWLSERAGVIQATRLRIGLDCANGAAYRVAPRVLRSTGAALTVIGDKPDGTNINRKCGSTDLSALKDLVIQQELDFGFALDGDADRVLAIDECGRTVDGDAIIAILALYRSRMGALGGNGVVVTEWSNLGLLRGLRSAGIEVEVCDVGDKAVAEAMKRTGFFLGGEQSGHIIFSDLLPAGDGTLTAIELIGAVVGSRSSLGELSSNSMRKLPQKTTVVYVGLPPRQVVASLVDKIRAENDQLGERGRLILRASGTEPVVRVMAEADDEDVVSNVVSRVARLVSAAGRPEL